MPACPTKVSKKIVQRPRIRKPQTHTENSRRPPIRVWATHKPREPDATLLLPMRSDHNELTACWAVTQHVTHLQPFSCQKNTCGSRSRTQETGGRPPIIIRLRRRPGPDKEHGYCVALAQLRCFSETTIAFKTSLETAKTILNFPA